MTPLLNSWQLILEPVDLVCMPVSHHLTPGFAQRFGQRARGAWQQLIDFIAPPQCMSCDEPVRRLGFCAPCASTLEPAPRGTSAPWLYGGALAVAIGRFKYEGRSDFGVPLAALLEAHVRELPAFDCLVSVPLHSARLRARGYNQATLLASRLVCPGVALRHDLLFRTQETMPQARLNRAGRMANLEGAIRASSRATGLRILLLDDVTTTGTTLDRCRRALLDAGASQVAVVALALAP